MTLLNPTRPTPLEAPVDRSVLRCLWHHRAGRAGALLGLALLAFATIGLAWTPHPPDLPDYANALKPPSLTHPFGTDATGRDIFSRIMDGAHRSIGAALAVLGAIFGIGLVVGTLAGLAGGLLDAVLMRLADIAMNLPGLVLAFAVLGLLGPGFVNLLIALIAADWAWYARLARSMALDARGRPHVIAARLAGIPRRRIVMGHVLPGVAAQVGIVASLALGSTIGAISGFSFLGLGVQPPHAEWGALLAESRLYVPIAPWLLLGPATLIFLSVLAANLVGNALRDLAAPEAR
ncbi:ABC transporter permease [Jannaschia marina]|uniref:ABC transporter permease n=1 Tax=Jannaschia marina TaxID=2741674 RepID=UPI0015CC4791|nr:ABC transporter permease [Jannaschia marina]